MLFPSLQYLQRRLARDRHQDPSILLLIFCALGIWAFSAHANTAHHTSDQPPVDINSGFSIHWGDLPYANGKWQPDKVNWQAIDDPKEPPGRTDEQILWMKIQLPTGDWRDPYLYIASIDLTAQVYFKDRQIYHYGDIDMQGNSQFAGWPWHLIRLPDNYAAQPLYFRIYSDYPFIGLSGTISLGDKNDLLSIVYHRGFIGLIFVISVFLVALISGILGTIQKEGAFALSTSALSFDLALMMFAENELSQVVWYHPLVWRYIAAFSYFLIPAFLAAVTYFWFKRKPPLINYLILFVSLAFTLGVAVLDISSNYNFVNAYPIFDVLFIFCLLGLFIGCYDRYRHGNYEDIGITAGIFALFVSLLLDMLSANGYIPWINHAGQWGLVLFSIACLAIFLINDRKRQLQLNSLTISLEDAVETRTAELIKSQAKLRQLAREDYLTRLLTRRAFVESATVEIKNALRYQRLLVAVLFDIDHFKVINDQYGHKIGDDLLEGVARITRSSCREGDLICRYGGEEFVILLQCADEKNAVDFVSRLRKLTNLFSVTNDQNDTIHVTCSYGLASMQDIASDDPEYILQELLERSDKAMYKVKRNGRDNIEVYKEFATE